MCLENRVLFGMFNYNKTNFTNSGFSMDLRTTNQELFDFYIVNTPRHWWIAQAMANNLRRPAVLLIFEGFKGSRTLYEIALSQNNFLFSKVVLVTGKLSGQDGSKIKAKFYRKLEWSRAKKTLNTLFFDYPPRRVLTANVNSVHVQYLYRLTKKQDSKVEFHVIDDGLQSYHPETRRPKRSLSLLYASIKYGFRIDTAPKNHLFSFFSEGWFFDASLVHDRFFHLQCHNISNDWFESSYMKKLQDNTLTVFGLDMSCWNQPKVVFVFTKLSLLKENCKNFDQSVFEKHIEHFINEKDVSNHSLWVKYHPREPEQDPFNLKDKFYSIQFVPATLPFELLSSGLHSKDMVVGEQSTVLFDVAINRKDVDVYSLGCSGPSSNVGKLFDSAGVMRF